VDENEVAVLGFARVVGCELASIMPSATAGAIGAN
jgi:hypothetical protein